MTGSSTTAMYLGWPCFTCLWTPVRQGWSLPDLVDDVRTGFGTQPIREAFEGLLLEGGYVDAHADRYKEPHYKMRVAQMFHVRDGFPRLIEGDIPAGVGDLRYTVVLAALTFASHRRARLAWVCKGRCS